MKTIDKPLNRDKARFQLVYQGSDMAAAERAGIDFWKNCSPEQKLKAIFSLVSDYCRMKGISSNDGKKFLRTTAVIKRL